MVRSDHCRIGLWSCEVVVVSWSDQVDLWLGRVGSWSSGVVPGAGSGRGHIGLRFGRVVIWLGSIDMYTAFIVT